MDPQNERMKEAARSEHDTSDMQADIAHTREALGQKIETIQTRAREAFSLDHHMDAHPWAVLGLSTGAGFVLGSVVGSPSRDTSPRETSPGDDIEPPRAEAPRRFPSARAGELSELVPKLRLAIFSVVSSMARQVIRENAPKLGGEIDRAWREFGLDDALRRHRERPPEPPRERSVEAELGAGPPRSRAVH